MIRYYSFFKSGKLEPVTFSAYHTFSDPFIFKLFTNENSSWLFLHLTVYTHLKNDIAVNSIVVHSSFNSILVFACFILSVINIKDWISLSLQLRSGDLALITIDEKQYNLIGPLQCSYIYSRLHILPVNVVFHHKWPPPSFRSRWVPGRFHRHLAFHSPEPDPQPSQAKSPSLCIQSATKTWLFCS